MQVYREFTQEWDNHISEFNKLQENNVLYDFFDYCDNLYTDLKTIKENYESSFNSLSKKTIDKYIVDFEKLYSAFKKVCFKSDEYKNTYSAILLQEKLPDAVVTTNGNHQRINDKYFKKLKSLANEIFKCEAECVEAVEQIWMDTLTSCKEHNYDNYSYLAHVSINQWRKQALTDEFKEYCDNLTCYATSYINNDKTKFFLERQYKAAGMVGYLVKFDKGAFIAGGNNDIFATEYINGKCEFVEKYNYSPVKRLYVKGNNVVYGNGTRICTPKSAITSAVGTPNEILLDKDHIHLERAFYVRPYWDQYKEEILNRANEMAKNTPNEDPLQLCSFNKLKQVDYDLFCEM